MNALPRRLVTMCVGAALAVAVAGAAWDVLHFGASADATAARLEGEIRRRLVNQTRRVEALARSVAAEAPGVLAAQASPDAVPPLFSRLLELASPVGFADTSATVYSVAAGGFRVLAWSDGPAEDLAAERLAGPRALFVAPGASGLRLVAVHPIDAGGTRIAVAVAERVLATPLGQHISRTPDACTGRLQTSFGPVTGIGPCRGAAPPGAADDAKGFVITGEAGQHLLEIRYDPAQLTAGRDRYRRRVAAAAAVPLIVLLLLATGPLLSYRNRRRTVVAWIRWTALTAAVVLAAALAAAGLALLADLRAIVPAISGLTAVALAALVAGGWWWRPVRRGPRQASRGRFVIEHAGGGSVVAGAIYGLSRLIQGRVASESIAVWQFPLFPFDGDAVVRFVGIILTQIAVTWSVAVVLSVLADRWRLGRRGPAPVVLAIVLWLSPTGVWLLLWRDAAWPVAGPWIGAAGALAAFGALAGLLRRLYRHTTHAMRLVLLFGALAAPPLVSYPITAAAADDAARALIASEFAPAMLRQPEAVRAALDAARAEVDALGDLLRLLSGPTPGDSRNAYAIWSRTSLATARLTSEIELFGPDRQLVSRFALNVPEYPYGESAPVWSGGGCDWEVFGEVARTGAVERVMLHAERGICDEAGSLAGAIVMHVVPDFASLPFVGTGSPYSQAFGDRERDAGPAERLAGLEVAMYGWNHDPQFTSGGVAWPIGPAIADRLYASRDPFWEDLTAGDRAHAVYFTNDRRGIYALGYPYPTFIEHATRLSEIAALSGVLLIVLLAGATAYAPVARAHPTPLPALLHEIRTSFYRKLFLFFVLSAVGPVLLLALAFGAYTAGRIRADVEGEAASAVQTTRRLFEEFTAVEARPGGPQPASHDALLVLIRQMTQQDVNLYVGPRLVATSQRDLFDSGLLPTRTPARVYREIALNRLPTYVGEDHIGAFRYLLAAAPVPAEGREAVISVPLGNRQLDIEHELDELNRRVLAGALVVVLFAAGLGATVAGRVSDPVARLSRAARQIAAGRLDVRIVADTADELRRLVDDFNVMTGTLARQRAELGRTHQLQAWAQMARQVAHEIKNPLTPIQLATEHLQRVHGDRGRPLGAVFEQCADTILRQVKLLRRIASDFSNFAADPTPRPEPVAVPSLIDDVVGPYRPGIDSRIRIEVETEAALPAVRIDRTLVSRALTNLIENAIQAMPEGGTIGVSAVRSGAGVALSVSDTGVGMTADAASRAFEPYFSTKTGGSGLGLPNARRYIELSGGRLDLESTPGRGTTITMWLPEAPGAAGAGSTSTR